MMLAVLLQAAAIAAAPSADAERLGRRLADTGTLATLLPLMIEKDLADLAAERPALTPVERARLAEIGHAEADRQRGRLLDNLGHQYAARLSVADLAALVAAAESIAAVHRRAIEPAVIAAMMQGAAPIDLKQATAAAFCKETGKFCDRR